MYSILSTIFLSSFRNNSRLIQGSFCFSQFQNHLQGIEFIIIFVVKPGAFEIIKSKAGKAAERQSIDGELLNRPFFFSPWFVVQDVDLAVSDLDDVYVAGDGVI